MPNKEKEKKRNKKRSFENNSSWAKGKVRLIYIKRILIDWAFIRAHLRRIYLLPLSK